MTASTSPSEPPGGPPTRPPDPAADPVLLFGLLSGPVAWAIYFMIGYLVAEAGCYINVMQQRTLGLPLVSLVVIALSLPALAVSLYGTFRTYRGWRERGGGEAEAHEVTRFLTLSGLVLNLIFILAILLIVIPLFFIEPCRWL